MTVKNPNKSLMGPSEDKKGISMDERQRARTKQRNGADNGDPLLNQLEEDCNNLYYNGRNFDESDHRRIIALIGMQVVSLRRNSVTQEQCDRRHASKINWFLMATAFPGFAALVGLALRLLGAI